ncbi:iron complex transport system ATP-binding protein [Curtobacterium luteum]|uniref:Iron complex transport system ATP-binding protein n=1 Tax=Curtobacterium luteum TaxID=33881 RepID=A0ABS2RX47_9MICO|nr:ABC transporter ATP-binding protein [Curtobacterium luteum]MBM7803625.1 iron complex transport system ATP-binding protein [Curtobacterium luteum]
MVDLHARDVTVGYHGEDVVHAASLELAGSSVTALVGPNGSGKSTLLRTVARLQQARSGAVDLRGATDAHEASSAPDTDVVDGLALTPKAFARQVALLTQGRPVPGGLRVRDLVAFGRHPYRGRFGGQDPDGQTVVAHALDVTGLTSLAERPADELSGGQLQRVWLASCLAQQTGVLLLDEPTTYLDLRYQVELLDLVRDLADHHGTAVGVVLHDLDQAAAVADRLVLLRAGVVVADGTPAEVLEADRLSDVYGIRVEVDHDPTTGRLRTRAVGRHHSRTTPAPAR